LAAAEILCVGGARCASPATRRIPPLPTLCRFRASAAAWFLFWHRRGFSRSGGAQSAAPPKPRVPRRILPPLRGGDSLWWYVTVRCQLA
jgi:hypothetical protein